MKLSSLTDKVSKKGLPSGLERACLCAKIGAENKGKNILVLNMKGISQLYDYFVIITGASRRQIHNIAEEIDSAMKNLGDKRIGIEGYEASKWVVQDYGDVMVHVFDNNARDFYGLEELWADAPKIDWEKN